MTEDKMRQFNAHCAQIKSYCLTCAMLCERCHGALVNHNPKWQQHRKQLNVLCGCQGQNQWLTVLYRAFRMKSQGVDDTVSCDKQLLQQKGPRLPSGSEDSGLSCPESTYNNAVLHQHLRLYPYEMSMLQVILDEQPQPTYFASDMLRYADDANCFLGQTLFTARAPSHACMVHLLVQDKWDLDTSVWKCSNCFWHPK